MNLNHVPTRWQTAGMLFRKVALFGAVALLAWAFFMLSTGCIPPRAGSPCIATNAAYCVGNVARSCQGGILVDYPCPGPKGCVMDSSRKDICDQSRGAEVGQLCFPEYEGKRQCSADGSVLLQCVSGAWAGAACPSGQTCHTDADGVICR